MRSPIRALSFGCTVLACCLAVAQQPHGLNRVPPPIQEVLVPPPPYAMDSSVWGTPDLLMRVNKGLGTPGMNLYVPQAEQAAPAMNTNDALLWGPYDLTVTEGRSEWSDRERLSPVCRPPACWNLWPWNLSIDGMGGCGLPRVNATPR